MNVTNFSLNERDGYITQIENQIQSKRNLLLENKKILEKTSKQNQFLQGINNDYKKYHTYIVKQKEDQIKSMGLLQQYIDDIIVSGQHTNKDIKKSKEEQQTILNEMSKIKKNLDDIIK